MHNLGQGKARRHSSGVFYPLKWYKNASLHTLLPN